MGAERKSHYVTEESKKMTAYHEGGHALVALHTPGAMPLHKVYVPFSPGRWFGYRLKRVGRSCLEVRLWVLLSSSLSKTKVRSTPNRALRVVDWSDSYTRREFSAMIDVALGGRAAEEMIYGHDDVTSGCSSDLQRATDVATRMIRVSADGLPYWTHY